MYVAEAADAPLRSAISTAAGSSLSWSGRWSCWNSRSGREWRHWSSTSFAANVACWIAASISSRADARQTCARGVRISSGFESRTRTRWRWRTGAPGASRSPAQLDIAVVRLPAISNYDDFLALEHEPDVVVRFVETVGEIEGADLVVIPAPRARSPTWSGCGVRQIAVAIESRAHRGEPVLGVCAGCQMLGQSIRTRTAWNRERRWWPDWGCWRSERASNRPS